MFPQYFNFHIHLVRDHRRLKSADLLSTRCINFQSLACINLHPPLTYVKEEMNRAERLEDGTRRGAVGFALTTLQRRLASSPEAIYQSLRRRHQRLEHELNKLKLGQRGQSVLDSWKGRAPDNLEDAADEMSGEAFEDFEEEVVDQATAAQTMQELQAEIDILSDLVEQASKVVHSGQDRKWEELSRLLQNTPEMLDSEGRLRKLIIFSEHRDTLNYLVQKVAGVVGYANAIGVIHGGVKRDERRGIQERFRNDPVMRVLIATDAAGEGVNLQNANLMVNYDLPWNPNRLEQRFGRIHRIGQTEVCHLWNIVAAETREGAVRGGPANRDIRLSEISASMGDGNRLPRSRSNEKTPP